MGNHRSRISTKLLKQRVSRALTSGIVLCCVLAAPALHGQANLGRISGSVMDSSGAAVVGAKVTVTDANRGISRTLVADGAGEYSAPNLLPGTYTIRTESKGFQAVERPNVLLEVGKDIRVDLTLTAGQETQTIDVTASAPVVDTTGYSLGGTLSNKTINDLPLNGRNYINLVTLRPGMEVYPGGGSSTRSSNGLRAEDIGFLIDGVRGDEPYTGESVLNAPIPAGDSSSSLPIDAIQEFNTEENPKAEFGWKPGAVVNAGIKSGTNRLHGTAFAFGRDGSWDARNYFNNAPQPKAPAALEQFGGSAGGPILKDKLFWFASYEGQRYTVSSTLPTSAPATTSLATGANPTGNPQMSLVDACRAVEAAGEQISALSAHIAGLNPADCSIAPANFTPGSSESLFPTNPTGSPIVLGLVSTNHQDNGVVKVDYHVNDHHSLNGMYFMGVGGGVWNDDLSEASSIWLSDLGPVHVNVGSGNWVYTPNSTWVNELKVGYNRYFAPFLSADHNVNPTAYGINTGVTDSRFFGFPEIQFNGISPFHLGSPGWPKVTGPDSSLQIVDHISYLRGKHTFKFGAEFIRNASKPFQAQGGKGFIKFTGGNDPVISNSTSLEDFFSGNPGNGSSILVGDPLRHLHNEQYAVFAQDDFRLTPRVTLNLGLRYELSTVLKDEHGQLGNFDPNRGLVQVGKGINSIYNGDHLDFSPRFGMAWDISGNGKTVIRLGASILYEQLPIDVFIAVSNQLGLNQVPTGASITTLDPSSGQPVTVAGSGSIGVENVNVPGSLLTPGWHNNSSTSIFPSSVFALRCGDGLGSDPSPCNTEAVDPNLRSPFVTTFSLAVSRMITKSLTLEAAYVVNHGSRYLGFNDINEAPLGAGYTPAAIAAGDPGASDSQMEQAARPFTVNHKFPYLAHIDRLSNKDVSNYTGFQMTLTQQATRGISFILGYTYAHALDDASGSQNSNPLPPNSYQAFRQYGSSDFDIRHRLTLTTSYDIPGIKGFAQTLEGWQLNSIVTLQTGLPWGVQDMSNDFTGNGQVFAADTYGQPWNFSGSRSDFTSGPVAIPCWGGSGSAALGGCTITTPAPPAACMDAASRNGPDAVASLLATGCYVKGNSALTPPALGTVGNSGRNTFRDSGFRDWDVSVVKNYKLFHEVSAQLRGEFFNVLNHPIFANPFGPAGLSANDASSSSLFGCGCATPDQAAPNPVLGSGASRSIQIGAKFIF
jgi:hypothetical protein